jgi:hypothetical protein
MMIFSYQENTLAYPYLERRYVNRKSLLVNIKNIRLTNRKPREI